MLTAYGKWAKDRPSFARCGSAEGRYRSTDVHHGAAVPVVLIADWSAADVQRSLNQVPEGHRRLLTAWYVPSRGQGAKLRQLRKSAGLAQLRQALIEGLQMFSNIHRF